MEVRKYVCKCVCIYIYFIYLWGENAREKERRISNDRLPDTSIDR